MLEVKVWLELSRWFLRIRLVFVLSLGVDRHASVRQPLPERTKMVSATPSKTI
jgi:hypothetical protein